jgi:riboflavin kinase/FMN adenylyltransferase
MHLIRGFQTANNNSLRIQSNHNKSTVVTIGNFDGVHRGHQAILKQVVDVAKSLHAIPTVVTFEPHPEEYFLGANAPARITRFAEKYALLQKFGIEQICCLRFSKKLSKMPAEDFVQKLLVEQLSTQHLIIGDDFHFGYQRQGNYKYLQQAGEKFGFKVTPTDTVSEADERISSTRVRDAILSGDFQQAKILMGHSYRVTGKVMHGDKRGRTIGFPTANLAIGARVSILNGVYAVKGSICNELSPEDKISLKGVANVGNRPTVNGKQNRIEAHWFDFDGDLYGKKIAIELIQKIRDEKKFESFSELTEQIKLDSEIAAKILDNLG